MRLIRQGGGNIWTHEYWTDGGEFLVYSIANIPKRKLSYKTYEALRLEAETIKPNECVPSKTKKLMCWADTGVPTLFYTNSFLIEQFCNWRRIPSPSLNNGKITWKQPNPIEIVDLTTMD